MKPPQVEFEIHQTHKLRFRNTIANPATAITFANLLETVLVSSSATVAYQLYDYVRVKEVEVWGIGTTSSSYASASVGVDFGGVSAGNYGGGKSYEDTTVSSAYPAYIRARPDKMSQAAQFQVNNASPAFHLRGVNVAVANMIVDVTLEFRNSPIVSPVVSAGSGMTPGDIYFRGLDGLNVASTVWASYLAPNNV